MSDSEAVSSRERVRGPVSAWGGLLPKEETQVMDFLSKNQNADGRGIIVGVLDTGVDPGAIGLQTTTDGKPKVIDIMDCSGSGDVKMYGPIAAAESAEGALVLEGKSGRKLQLNSKWVNPSGQWWVGSKLAYELYPKSLRDRVKEARKAEWMKTHRRCEMLVQQTLSDPNAPPSETDEFNARLTVLRSLETGTGEDDVGPILDCVVFHDGELWQAAVNTSETGDMSSTGCMTNYSVKQQFSRLSDDDAMNFAVNILEEGRILSIVVDAGAHGSHVAGIIAAHHPEAPERNGVAPGAQIVSFKIGDSHLGSMETGTAMVRALIAAVKCGCHILNMSYGEAVAVPNDGYFIKLLESVVNDHGIIFICSAGNNGPALSIVGSPGGTSTCSIGVGAFVTESLMRTAYSMTELVAPTNYTWSSVGPAVDGHQGVSLMAPGGAVTCVSNWTLEKSMLMNGTSMSSPNACGCVALLLSGIKATPGLIAQSQLYPQAIVSPHRIRQALNNSCAFVPSVNPLGQGNGLIQVTAAWEHLKRTSDITSLDCLLNVEVLHAAFKRGVYLRHASEVSRIGTYKVKVKPVFPESAGSDDKLNFESTMKLSTTAPSWVKCPEYLVMSSVGKVFNVEVDPRGLPEGLHLAYVHGHLDQHPDAGFVFQVPITVVKSETIESSQLGAIEKSEQFDNSRSLGIVSLSYGERFRKFLVPPLGCTFIDAIISDSRHAPLDGGDEAETAVFEETGSGLSNASGRMLVVHAVQLMNGSEYRKHEKEAYLNLLPGSKHVISFPVLGGCPMELCLARNWSTVGLTPMSFNVALNFCGAVPEPRNLLIQGGAKVSPQLRLTSHIATVEALPSAKLDKWVTSIRPSSASKVRPMGERDILPNGRVIYGIDVNYCFEQLENGINTKPTWPGLNGVLYESHFIAQFFSIFNCSDSRLVATGDAWPKGTKLSKGKFMVRLHVRMENIETLQELSEMQMLLERDLSKSISLNFYSTQSGAMAGTQSDKFKSMTIEPGTSTPLYVKEPAADQLPKNVSPGDWLTGAVTYLKKASGHPGAGTTPGGFPVTYSISSAVKSTDPGPPSVKKASKVDSEPPESYEKINSAFNEAMREAKVKYLKSLIGKESFRIVCDMLLAQEEQMSNYLPLNLAVLANAESVVTNVEQRERSTALRTVVVAADKCISLIDTASIALNLGQLVDKDDKSAASARKEIDAKKSSLVDCLLSKANALVAFLEVEREDPVYSNELFLATVKELSKWEDMNSDRFALLLLRKLMIQKRYGMMLKKLRDVLSSPSADVPVDKDLLYSMMELCANELQWPHIVADIRRVVAARRCYPTHQ